MSAPITQRHRVGGLHTLPFCVHVSLLKPEQLRPGVRAKELKCFFGEDVIDGSFEEEWMDGNNILLVVSAETYWFTAIIHPLPYLLYSSFCFFSLLITFPYFQTALSLCLSLSLGCQFPSFHTATPMCSFTPYSCWPQTTAS